MFSCVVHRSCRWLSCGCVNCSCRCKCRCWYAMDLSIKAFAAHIWTTHFILRRPHFVHEVTSAVVQCGTFTRILIIIWCLRRAPWITTFKLSCKAVVSATGLNLTTGIVMPGALVRFIVIITIDRTQIRGSPVYADVLCAAGLCVSCNSRTEAEKLSLKLTRTRFHNTGLVVRLWIHLQVAIFKGVRSQDHTASLGPGCTVGVPLTRKHFGSHVRAGWGCRLPAVAKFHDTENLRGAACQKVICHLSIKVPTKTQHSASPLRF